jgi:hypothetical protein
MRSDISPAAVSCIPEQMYRWRGPALYISEGPLRGPGEATGGGRS